jgi:hypothetical protein
MDDETAWQADRSKLRTLKIKNPTWTLSQLAQACARSVAWVKKWLKRFKAATEAEIEVLKGLSRKRKTPYSKPNPVLVSRILAIRDHPPDNLCRIPGPKAIAYFLEKDEILKEQNIQPCRSTGFIWKILTLNGRIPKLVKPASQPMALPTPLSEWQADFKDIVSVKIGVEGKKAHLVETLNVVD